MKKTTKVLLFDLETFPNVGYTWGKYEQNVIEFVRQWELASFAFKWLGDDKVTCYSRRNHSEKQLVKKLLDLWNQADLLIAHNGDSFDLRKARAKFIQFGFKPAALVKSVDTRKIARSQFSFNGNSLNELGTILGLGRKLETGGFSLWTQCMNNVPSAWKLMEKYNKQDVSLLEKVYLKMRAWAPNHPNMAAMRGVVSGCAVCSSNRIQFRGSYPTAQGRKHRFVCMDCGKWGTLSKKKASK